MKLAPQESQFQKSVLKKLRRLPYSKWFKLRDNTTSGIPDIKGTLCGLSVSIELKTRSDLEPIQRYTLFDLESADGLAFVCDDLTFDRVYEYLQKIADARTEILHALYRVLPTRKPEVSLATLITETNENYLARRREGDARKRREKRPEKVPLKPLKRGGFEPV